MTKMEIAAALAKDRVVEQLVCNIAHTRLSPDLKDLCQMVYLAVLEYDEERLADLWDSGAIRFWLAHIIVRQFRSSKSAFHYQYRHYQLRSVPVDGLEIPEEDGQ